MTIALNSGGNSAKAITTSFGSALSNGDLYGSYLFSTTTHANARTVGTVAVGAAADGDGDASFVWAGNGYNSTDSIEGPNIRAEGTSSDIPGASLTGGETYMMLFKFNGGSGLNSAWVLNQSQLTNFSSSLDASTLDSAEFGEGATNVVWKGSVTGDAAEPMSNLLLIALQSSNNEDFSYTWDEFRISDSSLLEATTVPEPSTALLGVVGILALFRRRRNA